MWKTGHSLIKAKMKETAEPARGRDERAYLLRRPLLRLMTMRSYAAVRLIEGGDEARPERHRAGAATWRRWSTPPRCVSRSTRAANSPLWTKSWTRLATSGAQVDRTDGARVLDRRRLVAASAASNTQDVLVARAEAKDEAALHAAARRDRRTARPVGDRAWTAGGALSPHSRALRRDPAKILPD